MVITHLHRSPSHILWTTSVYIEEPDVYPVAITLKVIVVNFLSCGFKWPIRARSSYAITAKPTGQEFILFLFSELGSL